VVLPPVLLLPLLTRFSCRHGPSRLPFSPYLLRAEWHDVSGVAAIAAFQKQGDDASWEIAEYVTVVVKHPN